MIFGVIAAIQTILVYTFISPETRSSYYVSSKPALTFPAFAAMVGFLVIFRQNFSYGRYHEGRTRLQAMTAAWFSAFSLALSFDKHPYDKDKFEDEAEFEHSAERFRHDMVHAFSLMNALCFQHLRCDWDLDNLSTHDENYLPSWDSLATPNFKISAWRYFFPHDRLKSRQAWNKASKIQVIGGVTSAERRGLVMVPFRLLTTSRRKCSQGKPVIISTVQNFTVEPSDPRAKRVECRPTGIRGFFAGMWTSETSAVYRGAIERPYKVIYAVTELIRRRFEDGGVNIPAPILATVHQNFNAAIQAFENCCYLSDTPFPLPWAQLIVVVLLFWQVIIPFTTSASITNEILGVVTAVASVWVLWALNEVARDIEDPFTNGMFFFVPCILFLPFVFECMLLPMNLPLYI